MTKYHNTLANLVKYHRRRNWGGWGGYSRLNILGRLFIVLQELRMREIYVNLEPYTCVDGLSDETQTSLLNFGFKRTRKGDDTSSSSDFTEPENADQHRDDNCEDYNILENYKHDFLFTV